MSTLKPVRRLYFQFAGLLSAPRLDAWQILQALEDAGLARTRAYGQDKQATHYEEADKMLSLPPERFIPAVRRALALFVSQKLKLPVRQYLPRFENTHLDGQYDWHGFLQPADLEPWMLKQLGLKATDETCIRAEGTLEVTGEYDDCCLCADDVVYLSIDSETDGRFLKVSLDSFNGEALEEELSLEFPYTDYWQDRAESAADAAYERMKDGDS